MSIGRAASFALVASALVAMGCNGAPGSSASGAPDTRSQQRGTGPESTGSIDLSGEAYSLPSGIAFQGGAVWVSNYVNGGDLRVAGVSVRGAPIIYRYDLATGRASGSIPSPSDWTSCLGFDGTALLATDYTDTARLFRLSPETGDVISSFALPYGPAYGGGIAWDGTSFYIAESVLTGGGPSTPSSRISRYSASGEPCGVIYTMSGSWRGGTGYVLDAIQGLAYGDGTLWVLVSPSSADAPFRLLSLSVEGAELSSVDIPGTAGRDLRYLGHHDGTFWTMEYLPMSIADFSWGKRLVRLLP